MSVTTEARDLRPPPDDEGWVGVGRASALLGINQSTLRAWTDSGRLPVFMTPGGHRRYRESDLRAMAEGRHPQVEAPTFGSMLIASREKFEVVARRTWGESSWYQTIDDASRRQFRVLGTSLLALLGAFVGGNSKRDRDRTLARTREVAIQYGEFAASLGLSLVEATEAFIVFRSPVLDVAMKWIENQHEPVATVAETLSRVNSFMDHVLLAMSSAHERARVASAAE